MKKTTLYLEPELDRAVGRLAASRGVSRAQAIRTALRAARASSSDRGSPQSALPEARAA
jgi:hypothetical protein